MDSYLSGRLTFGSDKPGTAGETAGGFQPLFVKSDATLANKAVGGCDDQGEPQIEVIEGANGIERIIIKCTCGKRIELKCDYE